MATYTIDEVIGGKKTYSIDEVMGQKMDLSKMSDSDLKLLASGNVKMMSTAGLRTIAGQGAPLEQVNQSSGR